MKSANAGEWAYLISVVIAVLAGIAAAAGFGASSWVAVLLVVLGAVVGLLNISEKETTSFLVATVALVVASLGANLAGTAGTFTPLNVIPGLGTLINAIVANIAIFAAPAAIIVAIKSIMNLASKK
jgi:hypothetical protein